jgi:ornithine decarboxylase
MMNQHDAVNTPLGQDAATPYLLLDVARVQENAESVTRSFSALNPTIFYPVKTNAEQPVLELLRNLGHGFDVASQNEVRRILSLGVRPKQMLFSAPVKVPAHVEEAHRRGLELFALDSEAEVIKLARLAPGARVMVRLEVSQKGSQLPLGGKFGVPAEEAVRLLKLAQEHGLRPHGLAFHVGSQCTRIETWADAIDVSRWAWNGAADAGIELRLVNLGGGIPGRYTSDVPSIEQIGAFVTQRVFGRFGPRVEYAIEPGRSLVADAGTMVTSVIGKAVRRGKPWIYVDLSIYAGLLEVRDGWTYPLETQKDHLPKQQTMLAGPTCDSTDVLAIDAELPDLEVGDLIYIKTAGAYTTAWRQFNGFTFPSVVTASSRSQRQGSVVAA